MKKGKQGDAGSLFGEFFGGMSEDEAIAPARSRMAKDSRQRQSQVVGIGRLEMSARGRAV